MFSGPRGLAVKVLNRVEHGDAYLDKVLGRELARPELNDADRRLLNELATGVLRWQGRLDWVLAAFYRGDFAAAEPPVRNALRVALYQMLFLDRIPHSAAVNESVEIVKRTGGRGAAGMVNGILRNILRQIRNLPYPQRTEGAARHMAVMGSHPLWLAERWITLYGEKETEALLEANNRRPRLALRVNPLRGSIQEAVEHLRARGLEPAIAPHAPNVLLVEGMAGIGADPFFAEGRYTVQDEAAVLACRLADARPGMRVIDLCAAPGGKSTALAETMNGAGEIVAVDRYQAKLPQIIATAERLGFGDIITTLAADARTVDLSPADVVLVDAPCSGLGVLAKKPDIKWKRTPEDIGTMAVLQAEILHNAAHLVKPGGVLVYATCTIEPRENEEIVAGFLREHSEFTREDAGAFLPADVVSQGVLATFPHRHGTDGMFAARMRRRE